MLIDIGRGVYISTNAIESIEYQRDTYYGEYMIMMCSGKKHFVMKERAKSIIDMINGKQESTPNE